MDLFFDVDRSSSFGVRVAAMIWQADSILLARDRNLDYWHLPGGKLAHGETTRDGLARELAEELGVICQIANEPYVIENFFELAGKQVHEIAFYYEANWLEGHAPNVDSPLEEHLVFQYHAFSRLESLDLRPHAIRRYLLARGTPCS